MYNAKNDIKRNKHVAKLSDELNDIIEKNTGKKRALTFGIKKAWNKVVPPEVKKHTDNVVFSKKSNDNTILVYVDDAAWAAELSMDKLIYIHLMKRELKIDIPDMVFCVSRSASLRKRYNK
jgi:hypothetical protein